MSVGLRSDQPSFFPDEVQWRLGKYVYRLVDPRTNETFYVGKGTGNRVFEHARGEIEPHPEELLPPKLDTIHQIKAAGLDVVHVIHRHGLTDTEAFLVEASLIDAYPNLTNAVVGHGSGEYGLMTAKEVMIKYALPELPMNPPHRLVLINIRKLTDRESTEDIYRLVRYCWRINKARAERAEYVLAVLRGVVLGAYKATEWLPATRENFQSEISYADGSEAHRFGFKGEKAPADVWDLYVGQYGKRITQPELRHDQYPIRYWRC